MNPTEQRAAAKKFAERWQAAEGSEERESDDFWFELFQDVLDVHNPTHFLDRQRKVQSRKIDLFIEDTGVLIENKSRGVSLDEPEQRGKDKYGNPRFVTPFEQAKWYADNMPRSISPRWLVTCNFDEMRIYDLNEEWPEKTFETILLAEIPEQFHRLTFMIKKENSRAEREKALSIAAGEVVGKLYDAFAKTYLDIENDAEEQRSLNILITRIVFLLYAEDADLLHERDAFYKYLKNFQVAHMRQALVDLFDTLKKPVEERDRYISPELASFPYVNGGLFKDDIVIPHFTEDTRFLLLQEASAEFDWSGISPTIFGAVFESTLNPETRRSGGMHYTSVENIHKLTGPLFYDELKAELEDIGNKKARSEKERVFKLNAFRDKIASLKFLDPACGSGNFLTETYLSLRKLENRVLEELYGDQMALGLDNPIKVSIDQFYGIEINDFAVEVAKTALWIAELQMLDQTREILNVWIDPLPLKTNDHILCENALRIDWNDVLPIEKCSYVIGNPPFVGYSLQSKEQKADVVDLFGKIRLANSIDYVACWFYKAAEYTSGNEARCAFVSTNSICQGELVAPVWGTIRERFGVEINFAWPTFVWNSEASDTAHVHVVIIGFSHIDDETRRLFGEKGTYTGRYINPYLAIAPWAIVNSRTKPISDVNPLVLGNSAYDDGNYILDEMERNSMIAKDSGIEPYIRKYIGAKEFIDNKYRYCIWLYGSDYEEALRHEDIARKVSLVREFRLSSTAADTRKMAEQAERFFRISQPDGTYLAVPLTSSEHRRYIPIGFLDAETIVAKSMSIVPDASIYEFGVMCSQFHNAWMRSVCGRLESRYRYSGVIVYNNFVWPKPTLEQRQRIERCAQLVLDARGNHPGDSLAKMYDGISPMPEKSSNADKKKYDLREYDDLRDAHKALDEAVEAAYNVDFDGDEERIVAHLFKLYAEATTGK